MQMSDVRKARDTSSAIIEEFIFIHGEQYREEIEERAAIMQIDGALPGPIAESYAVERMRKKYGLYTEGDLFETTAGRQARGAT